MHRQLTKSVCAASTSQRSQRSQSSPMLTDNPNAAPHFRSRFLTLKLRRVENQPGPSARINVRILLPISVSQESTLSDRRCVIKPATWCVMKKVTVRYVRYLSSSWASLFSRVSLNGHFSSLLVRVIAKYNASRAWMLSKTMKLGRTEPGFIIEVICRDFEPMAVIPHPLNLQRRNPEI